MVNEKMYRLGSSRSKIRELFEYGRKRKAEIGEENVFDFSLGNPSVPCPNEVNEALLTLINNESPINLHGYTSAPGDDAVRSAIAEHITKEHGFAVSYDDLYMTVGAAAALTCTLNAVVCSGEEVILLAPYFPEYKVFAEQAGAVVKVVSCDEKTFEPDTDAIAEAITERTAAIIVNSPNNPSGAVYSEESIKAIAKVLTEKSKEHGKSIYLIADEPYRELVYQRFIMTGCPRYLD